MRPRRLLRPVLSALAVTALAVTASTLAPTVAPAPAAAAEPTDEGRVVLDEDFSDGLPAGWTPVEGEWQVVDGRLVGVSTGSQLSRLTFGEHLDNYRLEATVRFETVANSSRWAALGLDLAADGAVPWWIATMRSNSTAANGIEFAERTAANTWNVTQTAPAPRAAGTGSDVRVAVDVQGTAARWSFDGQQVLTTRSLRRSADGVLGLVVNGARASFDDVRVTELPEPTLVQPDGTLPAVVAHRGYSSVAPENTLAAVEAGVRSRAEYVEVDAHSTRDGVPVVLHDQTVDRTTDGTGDVATLDAAYVATLDAGSWFDAAYAGEPVPTLAQVLDAVRGSGTTLLLEVKGPETPAEVERMVRLVEERGMVGEVLLQSFDTGVLRSARAASAELDLGLLRGTLDADPVATARSLDVVAYNPSAATLATRPEVVAALNEAGVAVMPYTLNDPAQWAQLVEVGVDGIITDRAGALVGWRSRVEQERSAPVPPAPAPVVEVLSPTPGAVLGREQAPVLAVAAQHAEAVEVHLDGTPVTPGEPLDLAGLALGGHELVAVARGEGGETTATATFDVVATQAGLASLVLAAEPVRGGDEGARTALLTRLASGDLEGLARRAEQAAGRQLDAATMALVAADARALAEG
ncbi:glycerophosphodiester phosphodiesterase family protein [Aquipuribacter sp. SD81]|uniref:glycerophosphodiester phosphodiesterase family protein n=1 Tax=Aquipuribacter sp. SD81 TaxID=3127703 RepID=UPI00301B01F1